MRTRYGGWLLSAAMMGAAGSLWAQSVIAFNANQFYFSITFALLAMLVIGGRTSLTGAVAGAAIVTFLTDTLARVEQGVAIGPWELPRVTGTVQFAIALLIIVTLILRPEGLFDRWEIDDLLRRLAPSVKRAQRGGGSHVDPSGPGTRRAEEAPPPAERARPVVLEGELVEKRFAGFKPSPASTSTSRDGEILGLIGPNGSGKTTLLNVVSGVYAPSDGRIVFHGGRSAGGSRITSRGSASRARSRTSDCSHSSPSGRTWKPRRRPARHGGASTRCWLVRPRDRRTREGGRTSPTACSAGSRSRGPWCAARR